MAKSLESIEGRLERVTAQLEQAAKRNQGPGFGDAIRPFLLGALFGAGAALLYAPQAGGEIRATLRRNAGDLQSRATEVASSAKERLPEQLKGAQESAQALLAKTKAQGEAAVKETAAPAETPTAGAERGANATQTGAQRGDTASSRAEQAQVQLRRDLETGSENPS